MIEMTDDQKLHRLGALSPLDGRYGNQTSDLGLNWSEAALMQARICVEAGYLIELLEFTKVESITEEQKKLLWDIATIESWKDFQTIKDIEMKGALGFAPTNHDVKAIEYYLQAQFKGTVLESKINWIHFGLTSEDVNNLAYSLMIRNALEQQIIPALNKLVQKLRTDWVVPYADLPLLARTHGQPATPTTLGKEFSVFVDRLSKQIFQLQSFAISAKLNGATGNFNALYVAFPELNWLEFAPRVFAQFNKDHTIMLVNNTHTTQIEPHDTYAELFHIMIRINTILLDFVQDMWRYISDDWIVQKAVVGEVGSSTMPHKVNPINLENAEGNLGLANCLFNFFATKLPISRLQRDLSDSTVTRNIGVAFGHSLIAYQAVIKGLIKMSPNTPVIAAVLESHPEVVAEAIQTVLRAYGVTDAYEQLKGLSRGKKLSFSDFTNFIETLDISNEVKQKLKSITPSNYTGLAGTIARL